MDINLPWYAKLFLELGGAALVWKAVQGSVPKAIEYLTPVAERATDATVALALRYPALRWLLLGNKDNAKALVDSVIEGARALLLVVEKRFDADLDQEAAKPAAGDQPAPK